jgi:hypothetical protein
MAIIRSDGLIIKAPKPADTKTFVGDVALMEYTTKFLIPEGYRFDGMLVHESLAGVKKTYRLEGGITDSHYVEQVFTAGEVNTASSVGTGEAIYAAKSTYDLQFKSLIAGANMALSATATEITIAFAGTLLGEAPENGTLYGRQDAGWVSIPTTGSGTVTSVGIVSTDGIKVDSGSPITGAGNIQLGVDKTVLLAHINVEDGADETDTANVAAAGAVMNTGNESVAGIKTFSSFPISPSSEPSTDYQFANKQYVDKWFFTPAYSNLYIYEGGVLAITGGVVWDKVINLSSGIYSNITTVATGFTIIDDGIYDIASFGSFIYSVNGIDVQLAIHIDNVEQQNLSTTIWAATAKGKSNFSLSGLLELTTGNVVSVQIKCATAGNATVGTGGIKINKIANT